MRSACASILMGAAISGHLGMTKLCQGSRAPVGLRQVVREKFFRRVRDEMPYELKFGDSQVDLLRDGSIRIELPVVVSNMRVRLQPPGFLAESSNRIDNHVESALQISKHGSLDRY